MKRDFQDKIFDMCCEYKEFREYITGIDDFEECPRKHMIKDDFERMMRDSLFRSPSQDILANIEHQSTITNPIMLKNLRYYTNTRYKYKKETQQHIFHTGRRIAPKYYIYDNQLIHIPYLKQTYEYDGIETFKIIKDKLNNNEKILSPDIFDLVWLPHFGKIKINDQFLKEYIDIVSKLEKNRYYAFLKTTTIVWIDRLTNNEKIKEYLKEKLNMMSITSPEFKDLRATAIYERKIEEKEKIITEQTQEITYKTQEITHKAQEIEKKEKIITEQAQEITHKTQEITRLKKEIAKLKEKN